MGESYLVKFYLDNATIEEDFRFAPKYKEHAMFHY